MSKTVLVTGGAGYIGCVLVPKLLDKGYHVRVLDKLVFGSGGLTPVWGDMELYCSDIRDPHLSLLRGVDAVIHLAGLSNDPTAEYNPDANKAINTMGTIHLAQRCKAAGISQFIFASSCSVYYTMEPDDTLRDEQYPVNPTAPYSLSKYEAERGILALADDTFSPVILRKGTIFGPSPRNRYDLVVNAFTEDAFQHRRMTVNAGGRMWRPMLHIEDACDAYIACLEAPVEDVCGQVFNVLSDNYRVIDIAQEVQQALQGIPGVTTIDIGVQRVGAARSYRVSGEKFKHVLGLNLNRSIGQAAIDMWEQLAGGIDPNDPIYYNIRWLELLEDMRVRLADMGGGPL